MVAFPRWLSGLAVAMILAGPLAAYADDGSALTIRAFDPTIPRLAAGVPVDPAQLPTTPVAGPWSDPEAQQWMEQKLTQLDAEIIDPEIIRLGAEAESRIPTATDEVGFYQAAKAGTDLALNSPDRDDRAAGLYIMLKAALAGRDDPWTFFHLGLYYELHPEQDGAPYTLSFYRRAADRDFIFGIANTLNMMSADPSVPVDVQEAYLRYGLDMNAAHGGELIADRARDFYLLHHPDRDPQGSLRKAAAAYRAAGDEPAALEMEYQMLYQGRDMPQDKLAALAKAKHAMAAGRPQLGGQIGAFYHAGDIVDADRDLARDYFVACLRAPEPTADCAVNLGAIYADPAQDKADLPLAVALWDYGVRIGPEDSAAARLGREKLTQTAPQLSAAQKAQAEVYLQALQDGDLSAMPHIRDARPVPELAGGAPQ